MSGTRIEYGPLPDQFGELRLPPGSDPHPIMVLIHGGCWLQEFDYTYFRNLAAAVTELGIATWTIEYRRVAGDGGWPMTFLDVGDAIDHLRELDGVHPLDLQRIVVAGHSAGGHLALWSATRDRLARDSDLYRPSPLPVRGVIGLAPIASLATYRVGPPQSCHEAVDLLMGGPPESYPDRYADASPSARLPIGVPMTLVSGTQDTIVPTSGVSTFVEAAIAAGDDARLVRIRGAGHFEPSVPVSEAWATVREALRLILGPDSSPS
ncbi:MAG TPA: alpha/beta hydrolase [Acidobacteriota bacterium]|nr:alpha/beta hydrolase [Acidobacteriota bacterium]